MSTLTSATEKKIILLRPRGFCAGVVRAIDVVKIALNMYGAPIYVRKEIVHNRHVVEELRALGAIFVEELDEVPSGARVIFSAHGVSPEVRSQARQRNLKVIDATCPLVTKVHLEAVKFARQGYTIVLIGHKDHDEVIGTLGEAPQSTALVSTVEDVDRLEIANPERVSFITQTTLSLDETKDIVARLKEKFPKIEGPAAQDICYATENRQVAVKAVVPLCELLLVVGSQNSSNSRRLVEVCEKMGVPAYLVDDLTEVQQVWLDNIQTVAVTAGASAPENLVEQLVEFLQQRGFAQLEEMEVKEEDVRFNLPAELTRTVQLQTVARVLSSPSLQIADTLLPASSTTLRRAADYLLSRRAGEGYWCGELTADTTLESDFVLLELWRHPPKDGVWDPPTRGLIDKAVRSILARQLPDGGFSIYEKGPSEVSASIKAYVALKLAGIALDDPAMARLHERIIALGGLQAANSYVKINLCLFGLYPREHTPSIPPELNLAGNLIYEMSSWTRAIVTPLSILHSMNPRRPVPAGFNVEELFVPGVPLAFVDREKILSWGNFFFVADRMLKLWERHGSRSLRTRAIRRAEQWILTRTRNSDGLGAIYPSMMYVVMALDLLGYPPDHPDVQEATRQFMNLMIDDHRGFFFQPCYSPVWDTAIAVHVLGEAGCAPQQAMTAAADWLLSKEVRQKGDWSIKRPNVEPSGWYFEFANEWYPDIDDTAQVLLALSHSTASDPKAQEASRKRAVDWLLAMQGSDGGWAAFDVDNNWNFLSSVPFADHNAMLDPTCPDITGRVLEALAACGVPNSHAAVRRGVAFLKRTHEADGSWYGRWGVDYIYGTYLALRGAQASGESDREAYILRAGEWLRSIQNADGGWGESCASYNNHTYTPDHSTPSQTAWAILGLIAGGDTTSSSLHKGIEYLVETQRSEGGWDEDLSTGTGFPGVFYLQYHLYRHSFPVLALAAYRKARGATQS